jgi:hypothetical protein
MEASLLANRKDIAMDQRAKECELRCVSGNGGCGDAGTEIANSDP